MKPTYSNDRNAPRMRKKQFSQQVVSRPLWRRFTREFPEYKELSLVKFRKLWGDIAETIRSEAITNPLGTKLGSYTGELKLQYIPYQFKANDFDNKISEEVGGKVNHLNIVTKGKVARIKWERRWAVKFNRMLQFFAFEPTRELRKMAKEYTDANPDKIRVARNTLGGFSVWRQL